MNCRICGNDRLETFLSFGTTPLANSFLREEHLSETEPTFPLELAFCRDCTLVQLSHVVDSKKMFKEYVYVSSTSQTFRTHFTKMASDITSRFSLDQSSLAVDIGSNDGLLLKGFQKTGVQVMGVEPAENIAKLAQEQGVDTINDFFCPAAVQEVLKAKGQADVVTANNVFAHVPDITSFVTSIKTLLKEEGVFIIEFQYLGDMLELMTFDNVYHEHVSYFSLTALIDFFQRNGMEIFDAERVGTHGGSLRAYIQRSGGRHETVSSVQNLLDYEDGLGVSHLETYREFSGRVMDVKQKIVERINSLKDEGRRIAGYGAPAKGNTLLNFLGVDHSKIDYIVDDNPLKQGLFTPGSHIPVRDSSALENDKPDYVLILAWNFADEILEKTRSHRKQGISFIIPLPTLRMVGEYLRTR